MFFNRFHCKRGLYGCKVITGALTSSNCSCFTVFWWGWISNCSNTSSGPVTFWLYYALRWLSFAHVHTCRYHHREKDPHYALFSPSYVTSANPKTYSNSNTTVSSAGLEYMTYTISSIVIAEVSLVKHNIKPTSDVYTIRQIIAILIAVGTALRAIWLIWMVRPTTSVISEPIQVRSVQVEQVSFLYSLNLFPV